MGFLDYSTIIVTSIVIIVAWRFSDWKNWEKYYSTILFTIALSMTVSLLIYENSLWYFKGTLFLSNHTLTDLWMAYIYYPPLILLYLSCYPFEKHFRNQAGYIVIWTLLWAIIEGLYTIAGLTLYYNNWNFWWSLFIWFLMFIGIRLHYTRPLLTWILCFMLTVFMIIYFHIPIAELK